jgi:UDP-2-acetamido-2-deoxy-ribo-hexuluronate aminotransferase
MVEFIDLKQQYQLHKDEINQAIQRVLDHGHFIMGPEIKQLEQVLAQYVGVKHCISAASGTDTLMMALMALGVGPGDEVITTPFTWISPAEVIALLGAKPVFVDIDPTTYNIDLDLLEKAITPRTKALMPVSLFGQMPDFKRINSIAEKRGLAVIEDAAQSFGAMQNGRRSCGVSTIGSTSFYPAKPLGCYGDGGALFTDDDVLAATMRAIRVHGGEQRHHHTCLGFNGRCDTLQAAIMLVKMKYFPSEVQVRADIGARYTKLLHDCCVTPTIAKGNTHVYAQYTIRVPDRDALAKRLSACGIPTAIHYPKCLHEQPVFANLGYRWGSLPHAEKASREVISLPMHPYLTASEQEEIVAQVRDAVLVTR